MSAILLVLSVLFFAIAALLGFGIVTGAHEFGWLALGGAFLAAALLVGGGWPSWPARA